MPKPKKKSALAETMSFAHLLPTGVSAVKADEDDDKEKDPDASEEEDDKDDEKKPDGKKAKRAKGDEGDDDEGDDADAAAGDDDEGEDGDDEKKPDGKKAKRAKGDAGDDGDDEEEDEKSKKASRAGALRERARCAAIFGSKHAAGRPDLAAQFAFGTNMSSREAIGLMKTLGASAPAEPKQGLASRMASEPVPNPGQGSAAAPRGSKMAAAIIEAGRKARGEKA